MILILIWAYLFNVHLDGIVHYNIDRICMFDINSIQLDSFIMGTNENSKKNHVSHNITLEERKILREKEKKNRGSICLILKRHARSKNKRITENFIPIYSKSKAS